MTVKINKEDVELKVCGAFSDLRSEVASTYVRCHQAKWQQNGEMWHSGVQPSEA